MAGIAQYGREAHHPSRLQRRSHARLVYPWQWLLTCFGSGTEEEEEELEGVATVGVGVKVGVVKELAMAVAVAAAVAVVAEEVVVMSRAKVAATA